MHDASIGPLPQRLLPCITTADELVPPWLSDRDRPWLREQLREAEAMRGRPFAQLERRWRRRDPDPRAGPRLAIARHVLQHILRATGKVPPKTALRRELFAAAGGAPDEVVARVAAHHGVTAAALLADLFADLPHARRLVWPAPAPDPCSVLLAANLAIAKGMLMRAESAIVHLEGAARAVVRTAWLHGGEFTIGSTGDDRVRLHWRFGHGRRSTRALAAIVPVLPWTRRFRIEARCRIGTLVGTFVLTTGDAFLPGPEPRAFDSRLEQTFAQDAAAQAPEWDLLREPMPLVVADRLCFPDFVLRRRSDGDSWLLEIAGLRDRRALVHKLAALTAMPRYLLCLPRHAVPTEWRGHPRIVPFGRRVRVSDVLRALAIASTAS